MRSSLEREVWGSNLGPVKSDTVLPTAATAGTFSSKGAMLPGRNDAEMCPTNSLHASAYYSEYNKRFDLPCTCCVTPMSVTSLCGSPIITASWEEILQRCKALATQFFLFYRSGNKPISTGTVPQKIALLLH